MMTVLSLVFSAIMNIPLKEYALFFFSGMIFWNYFNFSIMQMSTSMIDNEALINKIYLPKLIFPLSISIALLIDAILSFVPFFFIMIFLGADLSFPMLSIPLSYMIFFLFVTGIGFIVSVASVFFRDLSYILPIGLQAMFFLTPIIYPVSRLDGSFIKVIIKYNPVTIYIDLIRDPLLHGRLSSLENYILAGAIACIVFSVGYFFLKYYRKKIINHL
tara:strand:- start:97 stop:747 length:651 start_codon:yes stop_codon:yes gene_type:complete